MQNKHHILALAAATLVLASCHDRGDMPFNSGDTVKAETITEYWDVNTVEAYLEARNDIYAVMRPQYEKKIREKVQDKTERTMLGFSTQGKAYRYHIQQDSTLTVRDSSLFHVNKDTVFFDNPRLTGFYARYFYLKRKDTTDLSQLTGYLKRSEVMTLLEEDGSLSSTEMNLIREAISDAQIELDFVRYNPVK